MAIVNVAFAKRVLHTEKPVGGHFRHETVTSDPVEVVGVVEDGKYRSLTESQEPVVFWPILQHYDTTTTMEVKSSLPATQMLGQLRRAMAALDPELPLYGVGSLTDMLGFAFFPTHAAAVTLSGFGVLAVMLAADGYPPDLSPTRSQDGSMRASGWRSAHALASCFDWCWARS